MRHLYYFFTMYVHIDTDIKTADWSYKALLTLKKNNNYCGNQTMDPRCY